MARVFVDTNVLFPYSVLDLILSLAEDEVHEFLWTEALLEEWKRVITKAGHRSADSAARIVAAIREHFPDGEILAE